MTARKIYLLLLICPCILQAISCKGKVNRLIQPATDSNSVNRSERPNLPDFPAHYNLLLSFFERNKSLPSFDTDISFFDQGFGAANGYVAFIKAGHLFSKSQTHALLFYDIKGEIGEQVARMAVYKKTAQGYWQKLLDDTLPDVYEAHFKYIDWNHDGIGDLSYVQNGWDFGGHGPIAWHLWLVDKEGQPHRVKGFEDLDNPKVDSTTHHLFTRIESHRGVEMGEYKFSGNKIVHLRNKYFPYPNN